MTNKKYFEMLGQFTEEMKKNAYVFENNDHDMDHIRTIVGEEGEAVVKHVYLKDGVSANDFILDNSVFMFDNHLDTRFEDAKFIRFHLHDGKSVTTVDYKIGKSFKCPTNRDEMMDNRGSFVLVFCFEYGIINVEEDKSAGRSEGKSEAAPTDTAVGTLKPDEWHTFIRNTFFRDDDDNDTNTTRYLGKDGVFYRSFCAHTNADGSLTVHCNDNGKETNHTLTKDKFNHEDYLKVLKAAYGEDDAVKETK